MILRMLGCASALTATLFAQQASQIAAAWTIDSSGHRVEGPTYAAVESPAGSQRVETIRSINGRQVPLQATEDRVLRQDSQGKIVERTVRKYDANGNLGQPMKIRIE